MDNLEKFGWSSGMVEKLDVSLGKVGYILRDCAWPEVNKAWMMEAGEESDGRCTWVQSKVCADGEKGTETNYGKVKRWHS